MCRCWWTQRFGSKLTFLQPKVAILDPEAGRTLGSLEVPKGALLGGVYAYIDHQDRMVFVDGLNTLLRVAHSADGTQVYVDERVPLNRFLSQYEGDQVVGVVPDWQGRVWVASAHGAIGVVDSKRREIRSIFLNKHVATGSATPFETVDNSISACPRGVSVVTSHAIYMLDADDNGAPQIVWYAGYDRDTARKPGQLFWGSGASTTFFGPTGSDYVMLTDNADEKENLLVYETETGRLVGQTGVFEPGTSGTECSAIGVQNSIVVGSTYGYPYLRYPEGPARLCLRTPCSRLVSSATTSLPGGPTPVWKRADVYSAVVPHLSMADGYIYVCERRQFGLVNGSATVAAAASLPAVSFAQEAPGISFTVGSVVADGQALALPIAVTLNLDTDLPAGTALTLFPVWSPAPRLSLLACRRSALPPKTQASIFSLFPRTSLTTRPFPASCCGRPAFPTSVLFRAHRCWQRWCFPTSPTVRCSPRNTSTRASRLAPSRLRVRPCCPASLQYSCGGCMFYSRSL